uniref:Uncharacterized protein n=1 Tax=Skeletonema marinoi TaxID=267567 RepID=A0A7S1VW47_9STRA|mmetsp:Transcript_486/g.764  ORF Transcript_486/g.764 Transcript_486/m.764 type:complete len:366 (+) Transcript_486:176-1273(+)
MVFCPCRKTTTTSIENTTTTTTTPTKKRFHFFHRTKPLAYIATELDDDDEIAPTPAELKRLKSVKRSKAHVDGVLYRNRNSGRKTLLTGDGVVNFTGFIDWFHRKRLREKMENGERYDRDEDGKHNGGGGNEGGTTMIVRVQKIDPVKSGFMGKKTDRDETTGCAAGTMVAAQWAGRRPPSRPELLVTPRKSAVNVGCATAGCGADDSFATAATGCSPMSTGSVSFQEDNSPVHGNAKRLEEGRDDLEEDAWCGAFNSSILTEELTASESKESIEDYSRSAPNTDEESVWCDVFNSTTIVTEGEGEGDVTNEEEDDDDSEDEAENSYSSKIRGIQNVEVIYSEKQSMMKRVSTWKKKEDSFDQLQ